MFLRDRAQAKAQAAGRSGCPHRPCQGRGAPEAATWTCLQGNWIPAPGETGPDTGLRVIRTQEKTEPCVLGEDKRVEGSILRETGGFTGTPRGDRVSCGSPGRPLQRCPQQAWGQQKQEGPGRTMTEFSQEVIRGLWVVSVGGGHKSQRPGG